jgi:hypothetical protein
MEFIIACVVALILLVIVVLTAEWNADNDFYTVTYHLDFSGRDSHGIVEKRYKRKEEAEEVAKGLASYLNRTVYIFHSRYKGFYEVDATGRVVWRTC